MVGVVAGFMILITIYFAGVFLAMLRNNGYRFVETCKDIVEAIQAIKQYKRNQGTKGS